jgi:hypothetical protein
MRIPFDLPQFKDKRALIIITGKQAADFYIAGDGEMTKISWFVLKTPRYSDREGFFVRSGRGKTYSSGAVYETLDDKIKGEFLKKFAHEVKKILARRSITDIYLFAPSYMKNVIQGAFPKRDLIFIRVSFLGNFSKKHPLFLLKKIKGL